MNMSMSISTLKEVVRPLPHLPGGGINNQLLLRSPEKDKVVVVMGATGTGKSRLSIDLATHFDAEIINSDKIQAHRGLDIATNKITSSESGGIPHHLLGVLDPESDFSSANFRALASASMKSIIGRGHLPIIAGGSNSFIESLVDNINFRANYEFCFIWVDVEMPVLRSFVSERVNKMVDRGMVNEVRDFYNPNCDYSKGIWRAIGVPEFDKLFRYESEYSEEDRERILKEAIDLIKTNTSRLACRQIEKIRRLRNVKGWKINRIDATEVFRRGGEDEDWENMVAAPGKAVVSRFLYDSVVYGGVMRDWAEVEAAQPMMVASR